MQHTSPEHFASVIHLIEAGLGVQYPPGTPSFFHELSLIAGSSTRHGRFKSSRMLLTAREVAAERDELGAPLFEGYILPFLLDEHGERPDVYGFDMKDTSRIVVFSVHTIVHDWADQSAFLCWVKAFVEGT